MIRLVAPSLLFVVLLPYNASAQYRVPPGRGMSFEEASAISDYWIHSYLRRHPTRREVQWWADQLTSGRPPAQVLAALLGSREYYDYAGGTPQGFIRQLIADVGHREASRYEMEGILRETAGYSPSQIAMMFLRRYPANWWPGPAATPPRELRHLYGYDW